jgi:hypothetical protein
MKKVDLSKCSVKAGDLLMPSLVASLYSQNMTLRYPDKKAFKVLQGIICGVETAVLAKAIQEIIVEWKARKAEEAEKEAEAEAEAEKKDKRPDLSEWH